MSKADPLKKCPRGCLFEAKHAYCPWHGEPLKSLLGETIGENFRIERVVSSVGGFGVVYFAQNAVINMQAAVKVLRPNACYDKGAVKDFLDEAERTFNLLTDCPNTAKVIAVDRKPFPFICMSYVSGGSLSGRLDDAREKVAAAQTESAKRRVRGEEIPWQDCYEMLVGIARALEYAHDKQMVHRDLKPHNVLIDRDVNGKEIAKIVDWGIAIARRSTNDSATEDLDTVAVPTLTLTSEIPEGMERRASQITVKYAPPEFFRYVMQRERPEERNLKEVFDPRTDIYQFGLVAFELITGEFPFPPAEAGSSAAERFEHWRQQHCRVGGAAPARLTKYRSDFSRAARMKSPKRNRMAKIVARCLEKDPKRRFRNGEELLKSLTQEPVWKEVVGFAAAALVMVALALYFFAGGSKFGGAIGNFWNNWEDTAGWPGFTDGDGTPGIFAERVKPGLRIDGNMERQRELNRVWIRSLDDLRARATDRRVVYATPQLVSADATPKVAVRRWVTTVEDGMIDLASPVGLAVDKDQLQPVFVDGGSVFVDFSTLAELARDSDSGDRQRSTVYSVDVERPDGIVTSFFELRIDPVAPTLRLESVKLVAPGPGNELLDGEAYPFAPPELDGSAARLYVPEGYKDLEITLDVADPDPAGLGGALSVMAEVEGLGKALTKLDGGRLVMSLPQFSGESPRPIPEGRSLKFTLCVEDSAGRTARDCTPKTFTLELDSGLDLRVEQEGELTSAAVPITLRQGERSVAEIFAQSGEGDLVPATSEVIADATRLTLPAEVVAGGADAVRIYGLERGLLYPGASAELDAEALRELARKLAPKGTVSVSRSVIRETDFKVELTRADGSADVSWLRRASDGSDRLYWRTNTPERFPAALRLVASGRPDIEPDRTRWTVSGGAARNGPVLELEPAAAGEAVRREIDLVVSTFADVTRTEKLVIEYDPDLRFVEEFLVKQAGAGPAPVFANGERRFETRQPNDLALHCRKANEDLMTDKCRMAVRRLPDTVFPDRLARAEGNQLVFELPASASTTGSVRESGADAVEVQEGIYELAFTFMDAFDNTKTLGPYYIAVHREPPRLSLNAIRCGNGVETTDACYLTVEAEDPSGLASLVITISETESNDEPEVIPLDPSALREGEDIAGGRVSVETVDRVVATGTPEAGYVARLTVRVDPVAGAGRKANVKVNARDTLAGSAAGSGGERLCERLFACGARSQPPVVPGWKGLDWIYVEIDQGRDFYISKTEIPRWMWDGKAGPVDAADSLPKVGVSPAEIEEWITQRMPGTRLPTDREWRAAVSSAGNFSSWIAEGKVARETGGGGPTPQFSQYGDDLRKAIVGFDNSDDVVRKKRREFRASGGFVPVDFTPPGVPEFEAQYESLFYGLLHPLGNAAEIVVREGGPSGKTRYVSVGGSIGSTLETCITTRADLANEESDAQSGFRLVVYYQDTTVSVGGQSERRAASAEFDQFKSFIQESSQ